MEEFTSFLLYSLYFPNFYLIIYLVFCNLHIIAAFSEEFTLLLL